MTIPSRFVADDWYWVTLSMYGCFLSACLLTLSSSRRRWISAKVVPVLALMLLALAWVCVPALLAWESAFHERIFPLDWRPDWFQPDLTYAVSANWVWQTVSRDTLVLVVFSSVLLLAHSVERIRALTLLFLGAGVVHAVVAWIAWTQGAHRVDLLSLDGHFSAMRGFFVNRNHFAHFILMSSLALLVGLGYSYLRTRGSAKFKQFLFTPSTWVGLLIAGLLIFCVGMSESRAGFAGVFILIATMVLVLPREGMGGGSLVGRGQIGMLLVVLLMLVGLFYFSDGLQTRIASAGSVLGERPLQWRITLEAIFYQPLLGYGAGSYATVFEYFRHGFELRDVVFDQAHNEFLHIALEQGIVGLLIWISVFVLFFTHAFWHLRHTRSRFQRALMTAVIAIMVVTLFQALFDFNTQIVRSRLLFFASLALIYLRPERCRA